MEKNRKEVLWPEKFFFNSGIVWNMRRVFIDVRSFILFMHNSNSKETKMKNEG